MTQEQSTTLKYITQEQSILQRIMQDIYDQTKVYHVPTKSEIFGEMYCYLMDYGDTSEDAEYFVNRVKEYIKTL